MSEAAVSAAVSAEVPAEVPEAAARTGRVHWLGAGLSTGRGLGLLCDRFDSVVLWGRTADRAATLADRLGLAGRVAPRSYDLARLGEAVEPGDVVVSMLPAVEHASVLEECLRRGAHFACSSYASPRIAELAEQARRQGLVVLTEVGLDPGIDHLMAHGLVARAVRAVGDRPARIRFTSFCGGVPAVPNDFRYRFSWAPLGVLNALRSPARYIEDGDERIARHPWEATRLLDMGGEKFEVYPNRDSGPYVDEYRIPAHWEVDRFVRGTLRLEGWRDAWAQVFRQVRDGDDARLRTLAQDLAVRYPSTPEDLDRVVLSVALQAEVPEGGGWVPFWQGEYRLDVVGEPAETAMARTVSVPLALGVLRLAEGALGPGLHRAVAEPSEVDRWLDFLSGEGLECVLQEG